MPSRISQKLRLSFIFITICDNYMIIYNYDICLIYFAIFIVSKVFFFELSCYNIVNSKENCTGRKDKGFILDHPF